MYFWVQAGCGATYGVVPFVSRRSTGIVCGLVSAGGAVGGVINQAIFFLNTPAKGAYSAFLPFTSPLILPADTLLLPGFGIAGATKGVQARHQALEGSLSGICVCGTPSFSCQVDCHSRSNYIAEVQKWSFPSER